MQKITTFLTFNNQAEEAVRLYTSIFKNSKITNYEGERRWQAPQTRTTAQTMRRNFAS